MDLDLYDEEAQLNMVLEEKIGERQAKRMRKKFSK